MNRHRCKIALLFIGVVLFVMGSGGLCALADAQLSDKEFHLIQEYFNLSDEFIGLWKEQTEENERLAAQFSQEDLKRYEEALKKLQEIFNKRKAELFLKHGITEEEYTKTQMDVLNNPGKLQAYVIAGGTIPQSKNEANPKTFLTPEARLQKEGIILDSLNTEILEKAFSDPRFTVRSDLISVLGKMKAVIAKPYLLEQLQHELSFIRLKSVGALCSIDSFEGVPYLLEVLGDKKEDIVNHTDRSLAIHAAGLCLNNREIVQRLFELLRTETNGTLRLNIVLQIDQGGDISMLDKLNKIQEMEKDAMVRSLIDKTVRTWERKKRIQELGGSDVYK